MIYNNAKQQLPSTGCFVLLCFIHSTAMAQGWQTAGHVKYQLTHTQYEDDNIYLLIDNSADREANDHGLNLRLSAESSRQSPWNAIVHYELVYQHADTLALKRLLDPMFSLDANHLPEDETRLFDLTSYLENRKHELVYHRLDRMSLGYAQASHVFRLGRQAISWGNGMVFQPMDVFNPFSPTAIDKEYKTGDDLLYYQYLLQNGADLQFVLVPRRETHSGHIKSEQSSLAAKYHLIYGATDVDLLMAKHYDDDLAGFGFATDWQGAILRGDLLTLRGEQENTTTGVISIHYSWVWFNRNYSGFIEYYYHSDGIEDGDYQPSSLIDKTQLLSRITRGEIFTLGRDYLSASLTVELTPRWLFTPLLINNINDHSWQTQWLLNFDWQDNLSLKAGTTLPIGNKDTEFGGIPSTSPGSYYSGGRSVYFQCAYYF